VDDKTTDDRAHEQDEGKKPYTAPEIQEVPLRPEEAVLGGCKTASVSGPAQHRCNSPAACSSLVS
jgi:hypothetical protein